MNLHNPVGAFFLYELFDPSYPEIPRYVGWTIHPPVRLLAHITEAQREKKKSSYRRNWIRSILKENRLPNMRILFQVETIEEILYLESKTIIDYFEIGHPLTNGTFGGEGGIPTPEVIEKIKTTWKKILTPEYGKRISKRLLGNKYLLGYKHRPETLALFSAQRMGNSFAAGSIRTEAHLAALSWSGKHHKDKTKIKMSLSAKEAWTPERKIQASLTATGKYHTELTKAKMTLSRLGMTLSEEHKANIGKSSHKSWVKKKAWIAAYMAGERDYISWLERYENELKIAESDGLDGNVL